jgi:hypothetical protein
MASMGNAQRGALGGLAKLGEGARTTSDLSRVGGGLSRGANEGKKLNAAPWSDTFPAAGATLDLDFANNRGFVRGVGQGGVMDAITFTRASNGTFVKPDGTLSTHANQGALGNNLLTFPQDFDNAAWVQTASNRTEIDANVEVAPDGTLTADLFMVGSDGGTNVKGKLQNVVIAIGTPYTFSVYVKQAQDSVSDWVGLATFDATNNAIYSFFKFSTGSFDTVGVGHTASVDTLDNGWFRLKIIYTFASTTTARVYVILSNGNQNVIGTFKDPHFYAWGAQLEVGSTATEYFPTNIGEPRFDWASTDSTGAGTIADPRIIPLRANPTSNGILIEGGRINRLLWNRDATQTEWVKTNITAVKDQTGIDGVANAASSLTATDDNGTCIQTITLGAGNRTGSVYLKRLTGTGLIQVTLDGSTYSTVELSDTEWYRIVLSDSVTNPTVGIKIAVDGDAVAIDYGQVEDGLFATSPILTTTATASRAVESASLNTDGWLDLKQGSFYTSADEIGRTTAGSSALFVGSGQNVIIFDRVGTNARFRPTINLDGTIIFEINSSYGNPPPGKYKIIMSYNASGASVSILGNNSAGNFGVNSSNWSAIPTILPTLTISAGRSRYLDRIIYFPLKLNDTILQQWSVV